MCDVVEVEIEGIGVLPNPVKGATRLVRQTALPEGQLGGKGIKNDLGSGR
jgi:hypothetical protein